MPAERTRTSRRKAAEGARWTPPPEASSPPSIAFAPNITPGTFNDPPSPIAPVAESALFPSTDSPSTARRSAHARKKPDNHIPRPPNAFILFRSSFIKNQHVSSEVETNHSTLSKIIGLTWQSLPAEERQIWHAKAKAALDEHKHKWPEYAFRPLHTKSKGPSEKRKVREVGPKDMKRCAKIAELLVEGKKGPELDAAIQEFDRHHVPEIVTRFETPITARTYRRSSSAPVPDTEHSRPTFFASKSKASSSKIRASSSQPSTPAPSDSYSLSAFDSDSESKSDFYSPPSSPVDASSGTYTMFATNPSFDFNAFSFATCAPAQSQPCDPLETSCQSTVDIFAPNPQFAYTPYNSAFDPSCLTIDTTYLDSWTTTSSPISSLPSTPLAYPSAPNACNSSFGMEHGTMSPLDQYTPSYEFFEHNPMFANVGHPGYSEQALVLDMQFSATGIGAPKEEASPLYDRSAFNPLDGSFAPSCLASMSTFAI